ncbi:MAG TPA: hypothetical protein VK759_09330 [Rhizomicrobium sp.]|jgi:hypothetical protein|nr:hypothetical protein [Rhizomicrobium sp.]
MADEPENLILKQLAALRGDVQGLRGDVQAVNTKVDAMASTLVGVQREIRRLSDSVATLGASIDDHSRRLDHIEDRLGIERPNLFPPS